MTTSNEWEPVPTAPLTGTPPTAPPVPAVSADDEPTPIADELSAATGAGEDDPSAKDRAQDAADTAKEQGAQVADTAKEQAGDVASTAADEVKQVAGEAKAKASDLLSDVRAQVDEQSRTQLQGLSSKLGELGDELDGLIRGDGSTDGTVTDLARQLSERTRALSKHLAEREPSDLVGDVRTFARRRPGTFLLGAAAAGLIAGRVTRGVQKAGSDDTGATASAPASSAPVSSAPVSSSADVPGGQNTGGRQ